MDSTTDQSRLEKALHHLPHGRDFRFLDTLETLEAGKSGSAHYRVRGDEPFLAAHFPGNPMVPGVILIESIAQLGGVVCQCDPDQPILDDLRLTAVRNAKIIGAPKPGDTVQISVKVEGRLAGLVQVSGEVRTPITAGETVALATAQVTLSGNVPTSP